MSTAHRPREIVSLTTLRGYFAGWVVFGHYWNELSGFLPVLRFLSPWVEHGHAAVPGFFILSGWVLAHNYGDGFRHGREGWLRFLGRRLARIYPVHLAMLAAIGVLAAGSWASGRGPGPAYGFVPLVHQLLLTQAWLPGMAMTWNYPAWSISSEWFAYLLFPMVIRVDFLFRSIGRSVATAVVATAASVAVVVAWPPRPLFELVLVVPCFLAGMAIQAIVSTHGRSYSTGLAAAFLLAAIPISCYVPDFFVRQGLLATIPAAVVLLLALGGGSRAGIVWEGRWVLLLGEVSYSLYMSHGVVQKVLAILLPPQRFEEAGALVRAGVAFAWILAVALSTWGCYVLVERPARSLMRRWLG